VYTRCELISRSGSISIFAGLDSAFKSKWNRLYRASEHGFTAAAFHQLCDNQGPTVVLIRKENGQVAAGYSCVSWKSGNSSVENPRGFLCSIDTIENSLRIFKGVPGSCKIDHHSAYGPDFHNEVSISNKCHQNSSSKSKLGSGYESHGDPFALFGTETFKVDEYEVFGIELS
jgi:hypothetical protein